MSNADRNGRPMGRMKLGPGIRSAKQRSESVAVSAGEWGDPVALSFSPRPRRTVRADSPAFWRDMGRRVLCYLRVPHHRELARQAAGPRLFRRSWPSHPSRVLYLPARHRVCRRPDRCDDSGRFGREAAGVQCADRVHPKNSAMWMFQYDFGGTPRGIPRHAWTVSLWTLGWELFCYTGVAVVGVVGLLSRRWFLSVAMALVRQFAYAAVWQHSWGRLDTFTAATLKPKPPNSNSRRRPPACTVMEPAATSRTRFRPPIP